MEMGVWSSDPIGCRREEKSTVHVSSACNAGKWGLHGWLLGSRTLSCQHRDREKLSENTNAVGIFNSASFLDELSVSIREKALRSA